MRILVVAALTVALLLPTSPAGAQCEPRVLVLGAMPLEVHPFLREGTFAPGDTVRVDTKTFFVGELRGQDVVLAMTGIGLVNGAETVTTALDTFACIEAVLFSGVAGSHRRIGDVAMAERWTLDGGETWLSVDARLLARARLMADSIELDRLVPVGDDACACPGVETLPTPVDLGFDPGVFVGGDGTSGDTLDGLAMPCVPGGGDVFGCQACAEPGATATDIADFASNPPTLEFFQNFFQYPEQTTDTFESQDMESAAALQAAIAAGIPFLAIRGVSDGTDDPLNLPGFPAQFFAYRHLAANNAAEVTLGLLEAWEPLAQPESLDDGEPGSGQPTDQSGDSLPASGGGMVGGLVLVLLGWAQRRGPTR